MTFHRLQWFLPIAVTIHNAEEAFTYRGFLNDHSNELPWSLDPPTFVFGAAFLAVAAWIVTYLSWRHGARSIPAYLVFGFAVAMLANVFLPHVPLAVGLGTYNPGLATAVAINLPGMTFLLLRGLRERYVTGLRAATFGILVPLGIAVTMLVLFFASRYMH